MTDINELIGEAENKRQELGELRYRVSDFTDEDCDLLDYLDSLCIAIQEVMAIKTVDIDDGSDSHLDVWNECVQEFRITITNRLGGTE